ncbi:Uncharacterized protein dnm_039830 [Desulfonema magnum]|uniref:Uncharacterized protein n=1 Tax=Desulfonema magnum TaxID=45655 RepID=A0A975GNN0_9BACT|nr:Uncharacterized protein dnm_039830 [Desulfonema magnum]
MNIFHQNQSYFSVKINFENPGFLSENIFISGGEKPGFFMCVYLLFIITVKINFEKPGFLSENIFISGDEKPGFFMSIYFLYNFIYNLL